MKRNSHLRKRFLIILTGILCLSSMSGCKAKSTSPSSSNVASNTTGVKPSERDDKAITVSADQFLQELLTNQAAGRKKYEDKTVLMSGTVLSVGDSKSLGIPEGSERIAHLASIDGVICYFDDAQKSGWSEVKEGQKITVKGTFSGTGLDHCVVQ
jgi:superfamily I DNA and RNA helicase